jgi:hypothetical protein
MPSKRETSEATVPREAPLLPEVLDRPVKGPMTPAEVQSVCRSLKKAVLERALGAKLTRYLGYPSGAARPAGQDNQRNGTSGKTVLTDDGPVRLAIPRDRDGNFEPKLIPKHERRSPASVEQRSRRDRLLLPSESHRCRTRRSGNPGVRQLCARASSCHSAVVRG